MPELVCEKVKSGLGTLFGISHVKGGSTIISSYEGKIYIGQTVLDTGVRYASCLAGKLYTNVSTLEEVIIIATFD